MRLPVGDHLQPVLDPAQEAIGRGQLARGAARHVAGARQQPQRAQRGRDAQRRIAAAPDQLQRLRQEFDLADAALAQLHVVAGDPRHRIGASASAPPLCSSIRRFIAWMSATAAKSRPRRQTNGRIASRNCRAQRQVAGHRARLDHGGALPVLAHALVVGDGGRQRDRGRRHGRVRAQPQIGAEHVAVGVARLHQADEAARDAGVNATMRVAIRGSVYIGAPDRTAARGRYRTNNSVRGRRACPCRATVNPPPRPDLVGIGQAQLARRRARRAADARTASAQRGLGQVGQRAGDALQRPDAANIGDGGGQRDHALGAAQRGRDAIATRGKRCGGQFVERLGGDRVGAVATMARSVAASRTARSARYGLLPPSARSIAATAGCAARRASARPSSAKRSISRSAAPASCGLGQSGGNWKGASFMCGKAGVRRLAGQVALGCAMLLHRLATLAITVAVLIGVGLSAIAWRLSQGPIDLPWLTGRLEAAANASSGSTQLSVGSVALAWEGFSQGVDRPLELRVTNVVVTDQGSGRQMSIPRADVSLSLYQLLLGRVLLRSVTVDELKLTRVPLGRRRTQPGSW